MPKGQAKNEIYTYLGFAYRFATLIPSFSRENEREEKGAFRLLFKTCRRGKEAKS